MIVIAELFDTELATLAAAADHAPQVAPSLLAWIERAAVWGPNRRAESDFSLQPPEAVVDPGEDAAVIADSITLRDIFAADAPRTAAVLSALLDLRTGVGGGNRVAPGSCLERRGSEGQ
ncbi:MAG: hypothetical protein IT521_13065 [Burkholderiales bacterium]|nr:hypothetical protein [Burkholderiales bacterium]